MKIHIHLNTPASCIYSILKMHLFNLQIVFVQIWKCKFPIQYILGQCGGEEGHTHLPGRFQTKTGEAVKLTQTFTNFMKRIYTINMNHILLKEISSSTGTRTPTSQIVHWPRSSVLEQLLWHWGVLELKNEALRVFREAHQFWSSRPAIGMPRAVTLFFVQVWWP